MLTGQINLIPPPSDDMSAFGVLDKLLAMRERETRAMSALARAMRLTHQSRIKAQTAHTAHARMNGGTAGALKPWES